MKRLPWVLLFFSLSLTLEGQANADYGIFLGTSSYLGDINPNRLFYSPLPAGGFIYRYNLHPRQALRANLFIGGLRGSDKDFSNNFQDTRQASFSGLTGECTIQFEFNFLPFTTQGKLWDYTPYFAVGGGAALVDTHSTVAAGGGAAAVSKSNFAVIPVLPFSFGFKVNIYKNMGLEAEYGFRKTFYDTFDGLNDLVAPADYAWLHNNDWYTFAGVSVTWKIFSRLAGCPAYDDVDSRGKR